MALTTLSGVKSGLTPAIHLAKITSNFTATSNVFQSWWAFSGTPVAGSFDTTLNGVTLSAASGGVLYNNPVSGNSYVARFQAGVGRIGQAVQGPGVLLCDRLWHNGGYTITSTSAQNSVTPTFPARDEAGGTNGLGVLLGLEISTATGAGTPTVTVSYTNTAGTAGRTATNIIPTVASSGAGCFYLLSLQAGDLGVKSVESLTLSATWTSGTMNLVAFRPIALLPQPQYGISGQGDAITLGMPRIYDSSVLFFLSPLPAATVSTSLSGELQLAQG